MNNNRIYLRLTFMGAVEHLEQITQGLTAYADLADDACWVDGKEENTRHLDVSFEGSSVSLSEGILVDNKFERITAYFNERFGIKPEAVNKLGISHIKNNEHEFSKAGGYSVLPVQGLSVKATDDFGVKRHQAIAVVDRRAAISVKLDKMYPAIS